MGKRLTIGLAVLAVMPLLYVGSYWALVKAERPSNVAVSGAGPFPIRKPTYRFGGSFADALFFPLFEVDKRLRPPYWSYDFDLSEIRLPSPQEFAALRESILAKRLPEKEPYRTPFRCSAICDR